MNWRAHDLSKRAGATQSQPNVPLGKADPVLLEPQFSRKTGILLVFFEISNLFIFKYWAQYIKTPWGPNKTHLMARRFP